MIRRHIAATAFGLVLIICGTGYGADHTVRRESRDGSVDKAGEKPSVSVALEPAAMIYGAFVRIPRLLASFGRSLNGGTSLEFTVLMEGSGAEGAEYFQTTIYGALRKSFGSSKIAPYLEGGPSIGYARLWGDGDVSILAIGCTVETGLRFRPYSGRIFLEPYLGGSASMGPRLGSDAVSFGYTLGPYGGIRLGMLL